MANYLYQLSDWLLRSPPKCHRLWWCCVRH